MDMIAHAIEIAAGAHADQVDKAGEPYILHPMRVAHRVLGYSAEYVAAAWLHDVIEDYVTIEAEDLRLLGFPDSVVEAVVALTHAKGQSNDDYYRQVAGNDIAYVVKLADIGDNTDRDRLRKLDIPTRNRLLDKYTKARLSLRVHRQNLTSV